MQVNEKAPVVSRGEIEIDAPPDVAFDMIADIARWPEWNRDVKSVELAGPVRQGTTFVCKAGPGKIKSRLEEVERPNVIGWTGSTMGINAVHVWRFEAREGGCLAKTEESWEGFMPSLAKGPVQRTLDKTTQASLQLLKTEAERRAKAG
jgi:uncharacterized membrane protein